YRLILREEVGATVMEAAEVDDDLLHLCPVLVATYPKQMQPPAQQISTCPVSGAALEETSGGGLGCMVCLLRVGTRGEAPAGAGQDLTLKAFGRDEGFGVYEIERLPDGSLFELGRGAMGVTYRAVDTLLHRKAALKIIKIGIAGRRAEAHERFMREARTAAALRHENIATVFQFGIR